MIPSLKLRLVIMLLMLGTTAWLLLAVLTYRAAQIEVQALFDAQLAQVGRVLVAISRHEADTADHTEFRRDLAEHLWLHRYESLPIFQIWSRDGGLLSRSAGAPATPLGSKAPGYADAQIGGEEWRVLTIGEMGTGVWIHIADRYANRNRLVAGVGLKVLTPILWFVPLTIVLIWIGVGRGLAPLRRLAREVSARDHRSLEPISTRFVPHEVFPLVHELNRLFARLTEALARYSRFTADVAHELRTALAGIRVQVQAALGATDEVEQRGALERELIGVDRATHVVEQLMTLARIEPDELEISFARLDLNAIAVSVLSELTPQALEKNIDIGLENGGSAVVMTGNEELLGLMLRNLVDNAIRYTPAAGSVTVRVVDDGTGSYLMVEDSGPGIPEQDRERVFARFYRGAAREVAGCGLGLSIAQRIAELHGTSIELSEAGTGHGLQVRVTFSGADQQPRVQ